MPRVLSKPWLDSFIEYIETGNKEIPLNYIIWSGISLLASTMKGNTFIYYKHVPLPPNQYIVLAGPPGIGKGSIIKPTIELGKEAGTVNYVEDKVTPEKLIEILAEGFLKTGGISVTGNPFMTDHSACVAANELAILLNNSETMHANLCALWDQKEFNYQTKNKSSYQIKDMYFSLLSGCTGDYIRSFIRDKNAAVTGGFTARSVFVWASEHRQLEDDAFGAPPNAKTQLYHDLANDLKHISTLKGEVTFTPDARKYWKQKYNEHHNSNGDFPSDAYANFKSRISTHILKTSLTVSVSEDDNLTVTEDQLRRTTELVEKVRDSVDIVFKYTGERPIEVAMEKVADYIKTKGLFVYRSDILRHNRSITDEELTIILKTLEMSQRIRQDLDDKGKIVFLPTQLC